MKRTLPTRRNARSRPRRRLPIGRYRIERLLGEGGFGLVFLAFDEQLHRLVAVKVPHARLVSQPEDAELYLREARAVASLDHPNIVPVYDVGSTDQFPCYVVSKFIDGQTLSSKLAGERLRLPPGGGTGGHHRRGTAPRTTSRVWYTAMSSRVTS